MPSIDSGVPGKVVGMPSEQVVGMIQNEWTASIRIDGRHRPDYAIYPGIWISCHLRYYT